jgi:hypothetical protein
MNAGISNIKQRRSGVKRFLSLGAGVQSSYLLLQAATGVRAPYDYAIFANTKREPRKVMEWLGWLKEEVARSKYPFPIIEVSAGDLGAEAVRVRTSKKTGNRYVKTLLPAYVAKANGKRAMMGRRCTVDRQGASRQTRRYSQGHGGNHRGVLLRRMAAHEAQRGKVGCKRVPAG